jgi:hypothetical protein
MGVNVFKVPGTRLWNCHNETISEQLMYTNAKTHLDVSLSWKWLQATRKCPGWLSDPGLLDYGKVSHRLGVLSFSETREGTIP